MNTYTNIRKLFAIRFAWCWRITPSATPRLRREDIDGAKGVFSASGQLRIILGTGTVNKVYDKFIAIFGLTAAAKEGLRAAAAAKQRPCPSGWSRLWAGVFVPVLPAIVASALSAPWASRSRPFGGEISSITETRHAAGVTAPGGMEPLPGSPDGLSRRL